MVHIRDIQIQQSESTIVAIGNFDGMHKGHAVLINRAVSKAKEIGVKSVVLTFSPHPRLVIKGENMPHIFTSNEKEKVVSEMGVDIFVEYPFTKEFANLSATYFIEEIIFKKLKAKAIVLGENYRFGKDGDGDVNLIKSFSLQNNIQVFVERLLKEEKEVINSTRIRRAILEGNIKLANAMLGRSYFIQGTVLSGENLGSLIGFPTANVIPHPTKIIPKNGVYVTTTNINGEGNLPSITNVGIRPTFNGKSVTIETHLLDFKEDIYNKKIGVNFLERIRDEKKFEAVGELVAQIGADVAVAKKWHGVF